MTRKEAIYDIIMILTKAGYTDDSRLDPDYIGYKIDEKRAKEIRDSYNRTQIFDPIWLQDYGVFDVTKINPADDNLFTFMDCEIGKATLPPVVSFSNAIFSAGNLGIYSIRSVTGKDEFVYESYPRMMEIFNDLPSSHILTKFSYYTKIHNAIYPIQKGKKVPEKLRAILVLENPLDGYVLTTENVSSLTVGTSYEVVSGQIVSGGNTYTEGDIFTATVDTFTGTGLVQYQNQKRRMTDDDPYPFSKSQMEVIIIKLLTQEYAIEASQIAQIRNNSQDELNVLNQPLAAI
jgi:hypothetical protein